MKFLIEIVANQYQSVFQKTYVKDSQTCPVLSTELPANFTCAFFQIIIMRTLKSLYAEVIKVKEVLSCLWLARGKIDMFIIIKILSIH